MPNSSGSPQGRRILIAPVTGEAGAGIQRWRERHDPDQARRIPPHATLCYWAPDLELSRLEAQIRHAIPKPIEVRLGGVRRFNNPDRTRYVEILDTDRLDEARKRLYDGAHLQLPGDPDWTWHITCVRYARERDQTKLDCAASELEMPDIWLLDTIAYLELRGDRYERVSEWRVG